MDDERSDSLTMCAVPKESSPMDKLRDKKERLTQELQNVNNAISLLENAPEIQKVLEALAKVHVRL